MAYLSAYLGTAGYVDVGYTWYDATNVAIGARVAAGITDVGGGRYETNAAAIPTTAKKVVWDSPVGGVTATESDDDFPVNTLSLANGVETGITLQQALRAILATLAGKASGGDTVTIKFRDPADTVDRVTMVVDSDGNRSSVTLDL